tara:strand:- start:377 stop:1378 length:1002 start_codon:yes stop_codon:yes gene_type:complete
MNNDTNNDTNNLDIDCSILFNEIKKHSSFSNLEQHKQNIIASDFNTTIKAAKKGLWYVPKRELDINSQHFAGGSFSTIHDCKWRGTNIVVKKPITNNVTNLIDFLKEIQICSTLRHPNLVQFLGISFNSSEVVILFEKIEGSNLEDFISNKNSMISNNLQKYFVGSLITTFKFLHNCNPPIIYRDLKPANILVDKFFNIKLTDFGLSKYFQNETNEAYLLSGETGTIRYMAPEVFNNQKYNLKVDVYSLGLIIYYIYTFTRPFNEYSVESMKTYFQQEDLILSTKKIKSQTIKSLVNKCIDKNPQQRIDINELYNGWNLYLTSSANKKMCIIN